MPAVGPRDGIDVELVRRKHVARQDGVIAGASRPASVRETKQPDMRSGRRRKIARGTPDDRIGGIGFRRQPDVPQGKLECIGRRGAGRSLPDLQGAPAQKQTARLS